MRKLTIAIDGPAGSGKSTAARRVAALLGYNHIDTGAMYRAVALAALRAGLAIDNADRMALLTRQSRIGLRTENGHVRVWLDGQDVSEEIRRPEVTLAASQVSTIAAVRKVLVRNQRELAIGGGVVMEGRDIGSVVLPRADLKIFLTASREERARRRLGEMRKRGESACFASVLDEVAERDRRDAGREASPLIAADDAIIVDNTAMEAEEAARVIVLLAREKEQGKADSSPR
jgi:cytidylate kinase